MKSFMTHAPENSGLQRKRFIEYGTTAIYFVHDYEYIETSNIIFCCGSLVIV